MRRAFDIDVLVCPRCGGRLRLLSSKYGDENRFRAAALRFALLVFFLASGLRCVENLQRGAM